MSTPSADQLEWDYPLKSLTAGGQPSPSLATESGSDLENLVNAGLIQADGFWTGAIGRFDPATPTVLLQGLYFHVMDFVDLDNKLTLARPLPAAPATSGTLDIFHLFFGGHYRSNERVPGMKSAGLVNVTGVLIGHAGHRNGEGDGTLSYVSATRELSWQAPGDTNPGPSVNVSSDGTYSLFSGNEDKWIEVTVTSASLPSGDQADTITLTLEARRVLPDWEGYETNGPGKTRYHLLAVKNASADDMIDARIYVSPDTPGTPTTLVDAMGTGEASGQVSNAADWPVRSFWVHNSDKDDLRYVKYRSGNTLFYSAAGAGLRGKTAVAWAASDNVNVYPEIDIGLDAPVSGQFQNPADEQTAPANITFAAPTDYANGLKIGALTSGSVYGIWVRETVLQGVRSREDFLNLITVEWR